MSEENNPPFIVEIVPHEGMVGESGYKLVVRLGEDDEQVIYPGQDAVLSGFLDFIWKSYGEFDIHDYCYPRMEVMEHGEQANVTVWESAERMLAITENVSLEEVQEVVAGYQEEYDSLPVIREKSDLQFVSHVRDEPSEGLSLL